MEALGIVNWKMKRQEPVRKKDGRRQQREEKKVDSNTYLTSDRPETKYCNTKCNDEIGWQCAASDGASVAVHWRVNFSFSSFFFVESASFGPT